VIASFILTLCQISVSRFGFWSPERLNFDANGRPEPEERAVLCVAGDDRITLRLQPGDRVELILHRGAKVRDDVAAFSFDDPQGLVDWRTADRGTVSLADRSETDAKLEDIRQLAIRWFAATVD